MSMTLGKRRMQGHRYDGETFENLDLSSLDAFESVWVGCTFTNCDMTLGNMQRVELSGCTFQDCDMRAVNFMGAKIRQVRFDSCDLRQSAFAGVTPLDRVVFQSCRLQYASFYNSTARDSEFLEANLHGADLRFIEATRMKYAGSNLWGAYVQLGCQFLRSEFDERQCDLFTGMVARRQPNEEKRKLLTDIAGISAKVVDRLMATDEGVA